MATLTVRDLPDDVRDKLRIRAAQNGRSMEAEARTLLRSSVEAATAERPPTVRQRVERLQAAFAPYRAAQGSVVDELIAERRIEGWRENREAVEDVRSGRVATVQERPAATGDPWKRGS